MEEQIDFALLQELLTPRKQIKRAEVSRLLAFDNADEEDRETLDGLMLLMPEAGSREQEVFIIQDSLPTARPDLYRP
jgi:hypothetical protein